MTVSPTLPAMLMEALRRTGSAPALRWKKLGLWHPVSGDDLAARAQAIGSALRRLGLREGDAAAIFAGNCQEWVVADLGILCAGVTSTGLDAASSAADLQRLMTETGARVLFVEGERRLRLVRTIAQACPALDHIVLLRRDWRESGSEDKTRSLADLERDSLGETIKGSGYGDAAITVATSGTAGSMRAVRLPHRLVCAQVGRAGAALDLHAGENRLVLSPLHHVLERVSGVYAGLSRGVIVDFPESADTALADLAELQPGIVQAPPRIWDAMRSGILLALKDATPLQRKVVQMALTGGASGLLDRAVLKPIRRRLGIDGARLCLTAGAPAHPATADWFERLGRPLTDLYGQAETAGAVAATPLRRAADVSLKLLDGLTTEPAPGGELVFHAAEWAGGRRTGDALVQGARPIAVRRLADELPGAPDTFERAQALKDSPYVADAFLLDHAQGGQRALILPDIDQTIRYAQDKGIPFTHVRSLCEAPAIRALFDEIVAQVNRNFAGSRIAAFTLIDQALGPGDPELGPMLNLRRYLFQAETDRMPPTRQKADLEPTSH